MSTDATEEFSRSLVVEVPSLAPVLDEHLADMDDELLPHMFFGDVTRWADEAAADPSKDAELGRLLELLDEGLASGSEEVQDLITVSFLENLEDDSAVLAKLSPRLTERRAELGQ